MTREFVEARMLDFATLAIEHQQARLIAARERFLRDELIGQVVVEFVDFHSVRDQQSAAFCWIKWLCFRVFCRGRGSHQANWGIDLLYLRPRYALKLIITDRCPHVITGLRRRALR